MNAKPGKNGAGHTLGLYLTDQHVAYCVMNSGRKEEAGGLEPRGTETPEELIERIVKPWMGAKTPSRLKVVLGVPELQSFHNARTIAAGTKDNATAGDWLQSALQTQNVRSDPMIVDQSLTPIAKQVVAGLVACRRKLVSEPLEAAVARGVRNVRAEPGPFALFRAAGRIANPPRDCKVSARLFLGSPQSMLILAVGKRPVGWRSLDLPAEDPSAILDSASAAIRLMARQWRLETPADVLMIHGRPEIDLRAKSDQVAQKFDLRITRHAEPGYDDAAIARGLALGGRVDVGDVDLGREFRPKETIVEIFPWGQTALQVLLFAGVTLFLSDTGRTLRADRTATNSELDKLKWLKNRLEGDLTKEETSLVTKRQSVERFLKSRVEWSTQLQEITSHLPSNTNLVSVIGVSELERTAKKDASAPKAKKSFVVRLATPIPESGVMPIDIDGFLAALRAGSTIKKEFPIIELSDLKNLRDSKTLMPMANYSVVCAPEESKGKPAADHEAGK